MAQGEEEGGAGGREAARAQRRERRSRKRTRAAAGDEEQEEGQQEQVSFCTLNFLCFACGLGGADPCCCRCFRLVFDVVIAVFWFR